MNSDVLHFICSALQSNLMNCVLIYFYIALHELYSFEGPDIRYVDVEGNK